jgi:vacuolar-type H+-ATPase subunit C/Vma6
MLNAYRHAAVHPVVRAGVGRLLGRDTWSALLAASSLDEYVDVLSGSRYRDAVLPVEPEPAAIARRLRAEVAAAKRRPTTFLRGAARDLTDWSWRRHEIENLLTILRGVHAGRSAREIRRHLIPLGSTSRIDWRSLAGSATIADLRQRLEGTATGRYYRRILTDAADAYRRDGGVFVLENAVERAHHRHLRRRMDALGRADADDARRLVGLELDTRNVLRSYRFRVAFGWSPETILANALPTGERVTAPVLQAIATGAPLAGIVADVWGRRLPGVGRLSAEDDLANLTRLETMLRRLLGLRAREALRGYPFRLASVLAHGVRLDHELRDLVTISEAIDAGLAPEDRADRLIENRGR